jgi:cytochrome c-type biogenesis protein CcmH/NrfG
MRSFYDSVLRAAPSLASRGDLAPGYAVLAARELEADRLDEALRLYGRAVRLAPDHSSADAWRAEIAFIEAEQSLSRGVVDIGSYERAVALRPGHASATRALATLDPTSEAAREVTRKWWAAGAAALLVLAAVFLLQRRRRGAARSNPPLAIDDAPDTLPG